MERPKRKTIRLQEHDDSAPGAYFITVCTKNKQRLLSRINVGTGLPDGPENVLTPYGEIVTRQLAHMGDFYQTVKIDKFVVMPNHVHMILFVSEAECGDGPSGRPVPTNSAVSKFVGTFKRFCNKEIGKDIWQARSHDHVIRGEKDYKNMAIYRYQCAEMGKGLLLQ